MSILEFLLTVNGAAQLIATDSSFTFLGVLSSNRTDQNSISNLLGDYGGFLGMHSIRNQQSMYGGSHGIYSPFNSSAINPPIVVYQNQAVLTITKNQFVMTNFPIVDPEFLLGVYAQLGNPSGL